MNHIIEIEKDKFIVVEHITWFQCDDQVIYMKLVNLGGCDPTLCFFFNSPQEARAKFNEIKLMFYDIAMMTEHTLPEEK